MTKVKGIRYMGNDEHGNHIVEQYEFEDIEPTKLTPSDYDRRVAELIHERYSYDAEAAMAAKHRRCYLGLCDTAEAEALKVEAIEFEAYREQCKSLARI